MANRNTTFWGIALALPLCLAATSAQADVGLVGVMGGKAIINIDGGRPHTLRPGEEYLGVKLLSLQGGSATFLIDGKQRTMRIGQNAVGTEPGSSNASVTLTADPQGHFQTTGAINGTPVSFLVDTGATLVALGRSDAERLHLKYDKANSGLVNTANGTALVYHVRLRSVRVGDIILRNVECAVNPNQDMPVALLGMSFLNRVDMKREGDKMTLKQRF